MDHSLQIHAVSSGNDVFVTYACTVELTNSIQLCNLVMPCIKINCVVNLNTLFTDRELKVAGHNLELQSQIGGLICLRYNHDQLINTFANQYHCRHALAYIYYTLLKQSLEDFKERWNSHQIRRNRKAGCPSGMLHDL